MSAADVLNAEHQAVLDLIPDTSITNKAIKSGNWSDPTVWSNGIPVAGAIVLIPANISLLFDAVSTPDLAALRNDGTLSFSTSQSTTLNVETFVNTKPLDPSIAGGTIQIATKDSPLPANVTATINIIGSGAIADAKQFGRGFISQGTCNLFGAPKTPYLPLIGPYPANTTSLDLASAPFGWLVGDTILLHRVNPLANEDETRKIVSLMGGLVTLDSPTTYDHSPPQFTVFVSTMGVIAGSGANLQCYAANLTRNIVFQSRTTSPLSSRGHTMMMHSPAFNVNNTAFLGLGRTNKAVPVNTTNNLRGRYSFHGHRSGVSNADLCPCTAPGQPPASISGCVVVDSPGWGFVNHSSNIVQQGNIAWKCFGACFSTEAGNEIGSFNNCLAVGSSPGSGEQTEGRASDTDFGHEGNGFWLQSPGTPITNCIAAGCVQGITFYTSGLTEAGLGDALFYADALPPALLPLANNQPTMPVSAVPLFQCDSNTAIACTDGFVVWHTLFDQKGIVNAGTSFVTNFTAWNCGQSGIFLAWSERLVFQDCTALCYAGALGATIGIDRNYYSGNISVINCDIRGFYWGIIAWTDTLSTGPGNDVIKGGHIDSRYGNIQIPVSIQNPFKTLNIGSDVTFGSGGQYDVYLADPFDPMSADFQSMLQADPYRQTPTSAGTNLIGNVQLFIPEQGQSAIPYPQGGSIAVLPPQLLNKTTKQMWDTYHLAPGGLEAPMNAAPPTTFRCNGLAGSPTPYLPFLGLYSDTSSKTASYTLVYLDVSLYDTTKPLNDPTNEGQLVTDPTTETLKPEWNIVSRTIHGILRSWLIFGDFSASPLPPVASGQSVTFTENSMSNSVTVVATDPNTPPLLLTYQLVQAPMNGTLTRSGSGPTFTYIPNANYVGPDSFTFQAVNSAGLTSNVATVTIAVKAVSNVVQTLPEQDFAAWQTSNGTAVAPGTFANPIKLGNVVEVDISCYNYANVQYNQYHPGAPIYQSSITGVTDDTGNTYTLVGSPTFNTAGSDTETWKATVTKLSTNLRITLHLSTPDNVSFTAEELVP